MHHIRTKSVLIRFKLASWLLLSIWLLILTACGILICSAFVIDHQLAYLAFGMLTAALLMRLTVWGLSSRAHCPLCLIHPLGHSSCSKHRTARRLLGSYRFRVACTVIFRNYFHCPYCGEATSVARRASVGRADCGRSHGHGA